MKYVSFWTNEGRLLVTLVVKKSGQTVLFLQPDYVAYFFVDCVKPRFLFFYVPLTCLVVTAWVEFQFLLLCFI